MNKRVQNFSLLQYIFRPERVINVVQTIYSAMFPNKKNMSALGHAVTDTCSAFVSISHTFTLQIKH
jgi:hypothetical protein